MLKRYLLFVMEAYYPGGGWNDFKGSFESVEEAKAEFQKVGVGEGDYAHIVDLQTGKIVAEEDRLKKTLTFEQKEKLIKLDKDLEKAKNKDEYAVIMRERAHLLNKDLSSNKRKDELKYLNVELEVEDYQKATDSLKEFKKHK